MVDAAQRWARALAHRLGPFGFDLVGCGRVGDYNENAPESSRLDDLGSPDHAAFVIGNTHSLWIPFLTALRRDSLSVDSPDPLDTYTVESVTAACAAVAGADPSTGANRGRIEDLPAADPGQREVSPRWSLRFSHQQDPAYLSMQTLAIISGLGQIGDSGLVIHPIYGPWIALRAVVVVAGTSTESQTPVTSCPHCATACAPALASMPEDARRGARPLSECWQSWLAVRDACPIGRRHRYSEQQLRYHYTKDRRVLERAIANLD